MEGFQGDECGDFTIPVIPGAVNTIPGAVSDRFMLVLLKVVSVIKKFWVAPEYFMITCQQKLKSWQTSGGLDTTLVMLLLPKSGWRKQEEEGFKIVLNNNF